VFEQLLDAHRGDTAGIDGTDRTVGEVATELLVRTMEWGIAAPDQARAELDLASWAARHDSTLSVRMYEMFIEMWSGILRQASPGAAESDIAAMSRLVVALADGLGLQLLAYDDAEQTRSDAIAAGVMLSAHFRRSIAAC
jgi:hypothetical protein